MTRSAMCHPRVALAAIAVAFAGAAFAQAAADNRAASSPPTEPTTTNTPTTVALPTVPSEQAPAAEANPPTSTFTTQATNDALAPIGTTGLTRADSANAAFEKLAPDKAFVTPADLSALPGFGDAFAKADRDADGRLDRTEFTDAWTYYVGQQQPAAASVTTTTKTPTQ